MKNLITHFSPKKKTERFYHNLFEILEDAPTKKSEVERSKLLDKTTELLSSSDNLFQEIDEAGDPPLHVAATKCLYDFLDLFITYITRGHSDDSLQILHTKDKSGKNVLECLFASQTKTFRPEEHKKVIIRLIRLKVKFDITDNAWVNLAIGFYHNEFRVYLYHNLQQFKQLNAEFNKYHKVNYIFDTSKFFNVKGYVERNNNVLHMAIESLDFSEATYILSEKSGFNRSDLLREVNSLLLTPANLLAYLIEESDQNIEQKVAFLIYMVDLIIKHEELVVFSTCDLDKKSIVDHLLPRAYVENVKKCIIACLKYGCKINFTVNPRGLAKIICGYAKSNPDLVECIFRYQFKEAKEFFTTVISTEEKEDYLLVSSIYENIKFQFETKGYSELHMAVLANDQKAANRLIGSDVRLLEMCDAAKNTVLHMAAEYSRLGFLQFLVERMLAVFTDEQVNGIFRIRNGNDRNFIELLLESFAKIGSKDHEQFRNRIELSIEMLDSGARLDFSKQPQITTLNTLAEKENKIFSALVEKIIYYHYDQLSNSDLSQFHVDVVKSLKSLIEYKKIPDEETGVPRLVLMRRVYVAFIYADNRSIVRVMQEENNFLTFRDGKGRTALHYAAMQHNYFMLERFMDPNPPAEFILNRLDYREKTMLEYLLEFGTNKSNKQESLVRRNNVIQRYVRAGAKVNLRTSLKVLNNLSPVVSLREGVTDNDPNNNNNNNNNQSNTSSDLQSIVVELACSQPSGLVQIYKFSEGYHATAYKYATEMNFNALLQMLPQENRDSAPEKAAKDLTQILMDIIVDAVASPSTEMTSDIRTYILDIILQHIKNDNRVNIFATEEDNKKFKLMIVERIQKLVTTHITTANLRSLKSSDAAEIRRAQFINDIQTILKGKIDKYVMDHTVETINFKLQHIIDNRILDRSAMPILKQAIRIGLLQKVNEYIKSRKEHLNNILSEEHRLLLDLAEDDFILTTILREHGAISTTENVDRVLTLLDAELEKQSRLSMDYFILHLTNLVKLKCQDRVIHYVAKLKELKLLNMVNEEQQKTFLDYAKDIGSSELAQTLTKYEALTRVRLLQNCLKDFSNIDAQSNEQVVKILVQLICLNVKDKVESYLQSCEKKRLEELLELTKTAADKRLMSYIQKYFYRLQMKDVADYVAQTGDLPDFLINVVLNTLASKGKQASDLVIPMQEYLQISGSNPGLSLQPSGSQTKALLQNSALFEESTTGDDLKISSGESPDVSGGFVSPDYT